MTPGYPVPLLFQPLELTMKKRVFIASLALSALAAGGSAQAQSVLRIGFFPGPYADQFKRGVQPAQVPCTSSVCARGRKPCSRAC